MLHLIRINQMHLHLSHCCSVTFSTGTPRGLAPETFLSCFLKLVALCTTLLPPPQIFTPTRLQSGLLLFQFQTFSQVSTPLCINGPGQAVQIADVNHMTESDSKSGWITIHITSKWTSHPGCFYAVGSCAGFVQGLHRSNGKMTSRWKFKGPLCTIWLDLWFWCW